MQGTKPPKMPFQLVMLSKNNDGEVRYKTSIDVTDAEITGRLLRPLIYTNVLMMDKYMSGPIAVVQADVPPAEAVKQIEGSS